MRVVHCKSQHGYEHGENMCSTAALCMCIAMVGKGVGEGLRELVEDVMSVANSAHQRFQDKSGNQVASVADIVKHMELDGFMHKVKLVEYIICEDGCTEMTEADEPTSCLISKQLLTRCLASRRGKLGTVAAVLTCGGHSVAVARKGDDYSLFDSGPSFLMVEMNTEQFNQQLDQFVVGQCDVTLTSAER